jgi:aerobic-type carbon monoxide dehydrogenase small subunit (CoxS/CutS family)
MDATVTFTLNGQKQAVTVDSQRPLLEVLREDLKLTGPKYGCGQGQCGACSVLIDGKRMLSCVTAVADVAGKTVLTIEGLAQGDKLHPVQEAFLAEEAFQCGYCTPGMVIATVALLKETPDPSDEQILAALDRNLCRCCDYPKILKAVRRAAGRPATRPAASMALRAGEVRP